MNNDEIIVVRETPPGVEKQVNEIIIERGAGQGLPGAPGEDPTAQNIGDVIAGAEAKTELVDDDGIGVSNSEGSDILVEWTYASLKAQLTTFFTGVFNLVFALLSDTEDHGTITTSETFSSATKSEHTATAASAVDVTLVLTTSRPSMLIAVNVTTICTLALVGAGITYAFPTGQTANLTDLAVGLWHIVPSTTDNGANVVVRVQQVT